MNPYKVTIGFCGVLRTGKQAGKHGNAVFTHSAMDARKDPLDVGDIVHSPSVTIDVFGQMLGPGPESIRLSIGCDDARKAFDEHQ